MKFPASVVNHKMLWLIVAPNESEYKMEMNYTIVIPSVSTVSIDLFYRFVKTFVARCGSINAVRDHDASGQVRGVTEHTNSSL